MACAIPQRPWPKQQTLALVSSVGMYSVLRTVVGFMRDSQGRKRRRQGTRQGLGAGTGHTNILVAM